MGQKHERIFGVFETLMGKTFQANRTFLSKCPRWSIMGTKSWMAELGRQGGAAKTERKAAAARENGSKGGRRRKREAITWPRRVMRITAPPEHKKTVLSTKKMCSAQKKCARYRKIVLGTEKLCSVQKNCAQHKKTVLGRRNYSETVMSRHLEFCWLKPNAISSFQPHWSRITLPLRLHRRPIGWVLKALLHKSFKLDGGWWQLGYNFAMFMLIQILIYFYLSIY